MIKLKELSNEEILKKSMEKVYNNGYSITEIELILYKDIIQLRQIIKQKGYYHHIFSPEFGKAYWGEYHTNCDKLEDWQYHQHKMLDEVQAGREPLLYIERFLDE